MGAVRMPALWIVVHVLVASTERIVIGRIAIDNHRGEEVEFLLLARDIDAPTPAVAAFCREHGFDEKLCVEAVLPEALKSIAAWQRPSDGTSDAYYGYTQLMLQPDEGFGGPWCFFTNNFKYQHAASSGNSSFVGVYRTGDPLQLCFHVNASRFELRVDGAKVTDYRWDQASRSHLWLLWLELRLWMPPGRHILHLLLPQRQVYLELSFDTVQRELLQQRVGGFVVQDTQTEPKASIINVHEAASLAGYEAGKYRSVNHGSFRYVSCCNRKGQLILHSLDSPALYYEFGLGDSFPGDPGTAMQVVQSDSLYDEQLCSAVLPRAVIWVNAYRQKGILHFVAEKLSLLWY